MTGSRKKAIIVGAGIGGLAAAAALRRVGVDSEVYERATELKPAGGALSLMANAVLALRSLGIEPKFDENAQLIDHLDFRTSKGRLIKSVRFRHLGEELGAHSYGIHRTDLQRLLVEEIGDTPITLGARAAGYEREGDGVRVHFADGRSAHGDMLIGADGMHSAIRAQIAGPETLRDGEYVCWLATPTYSDPRMPEGFAAHYWGSGARFGIANIGFGRIYWWGTKNMAADEARNWTGTRADVLRAYKGWAPEIAAVLNATPEEDLLSVPAQDRPFLEDWGDGPVTLLGDAAHPMLTSLGQGAAAAVEDGVVLAKHLDGALDAEDVVAGLRGYEDERRARTRRMVELSHTMSKMEQSEGLLRVAIRNGYFKWLSQAALDKQNLAILDFSPATPVEAAS